MRQKSLKQQVLDLTRPYSRQGSKKARREQIRRMIAFVEFAQQRRGGGFLKLEQLGDRDVIAYWRSVSDLAPTTQRDNWYALKTLWGFLGRSEPRQPHGMRKIEHAL